MARITYTNPIGDRVLRPVFSAPGDRLRGWTPDARPVGDAGIILSSGRRELWTYRTDFTASFILPGIVPASASPECTLARALEFQAYARAGNFFNVAVEDAVGTPSVTCWLAEGADVTIALADPGALLYTVSLTVAAASPLVCVYGGMG